MTDRLKPGDVDIDLRARHMSASTLYLTRAACPSAFAV